jgi:hypothetical protein
LPAAAVSRILPSRTNGADLVRELLALYQLDHDAFRAADECKAQAGLRVSGTNRDLGTLGAQFLPYAGGLLTHEIAAISAAVWLWRLIAYHNPISTPKPTSPINADIVTATRTITVLLRRRGTCTPKCSSHFVPPTRVAPVKVIR